MPYKNDILSNSRVVSYTGLDIEGAIAYDPNVRPDATWDGVTMPFAAKRFDCAIATEVLEHVPDIDTFLSEVRRVLRPESVLFFTTPFVWPYHETPNDRQRWTSYGLRYHLEEAGFRSIEIKSVGNWHSSLAQMLGLWIARAPMHAFIRRVLRYPLFLLQKMLMTFDATSPEKENSMPRMCAGIAVL
jgi:SAM-dependent methyltransferase